MRTTVYLDPQKAILGLVARLAARCLYALGADQDPQKEGASKSPSLLTIRP